MPSASPPTRKASSSRPSRSPPRQGRSWSHLPQGVTVNPSVGAGLIGCSPAGYAAGDPLQRPGPRLPQRLEDRRLHRPDPALRRRGGQGILRRSDLSGFSQGQPLGLLGRGLFGRKAPPTRRDDQAPRQDRPQPGRRHDHRHLRRPPPTPLHRPLDGLQGGPARLPDQPPDLRGSDHQDRDDPVVQRNHGPQHPDELRHHLRRRTSAPALQAPRPSTCKP